MDDENVERLLPGDEEDDDGDAPEPFPLEDWLQLLETQRVALLVRLQMIDKVLIKHGRLSRPTLPEQGE